MDAKDSPQKSTEFCTTKPLTNQLKRVDWLKITVNVESASHKFSTNKIHSYDLAIEEITRSITDQIKQKISTGAIENYSDVFYGINANVSRSLVRVPPLNRVPKNIG